MNTMDIYNDTRCEDCKVETNHQLTEDGEWYMVQNNIWNQVTEGKTTANFLCIGCLEARLGRKLTPSDFNEAPVNVFPGFGRSKRLQNRQGVNYR